MPFRTCTSADPRTLALWCAFLLFGAEPIGAVTIETVPVGNPGNLPDTRYGPWHGSVQHEYRIGKYEVTNAQYVEFLNAVDPTGANIRELYSPFMSSSSRGGINFLSGNPAGFKFQTKAGREQNPVVHVSLHDALRFSNWLHNGLGTGDTENGAYTILDDQPRAAGSYTRNTGAKWWVPSFDELYKSAYHKNDGVTGNYWDSPFSTNSIPDSDQPPGNDAPFPANTANFVRNDGLANGYNDGYAVTGLTSCSTSQNCVTNVGAYQLSQSPYGAFDQGGNVWEWNERDAVSPYNNNIFGGSYHSTSDMLLASRGRSRSGFVEQSDVGFRLATIPEPTGGPINIVVDLNTDYDIFSFPPQDTFFTQPGFLPWDASEFDSTTPSAHLFTNGVEFELRAIQFAANGVAAASSLGSRNRIWGGGGPNDDLLRDFVFAEGRPGSALYLAVSGLDVGTYRMTTWHFDSSASLPDSMQIEVGDKQGDAIAAATSVVVDHFRMGTSPQVFEFQVTSPDSIKEIVFRNDDVPPFPGSPLAYRTRLNGFTLVRIPEPGTWLPLLAAMWLSSLHTRFRFGRVN